MYPEFVPIYVMLVIVIALLGVLLFFVIKLMKNGTQPKNNPMPVQNQQAYAQQAYQQPYQQPYQQGYQAQGGNIVFCKHCATQFDASQAYCPRCGTPR